MRILLLTTLLLPAFAMAEPLTPAPATPPVLQMEASAKSQIANDEMVAVLSAERTGQNVGTLNDAVMAAINDAVRQAKATPDVNVRVGAFSTNQNWENGKQSGWRVHGEVVLTSSDMKGLSVLVGKLGQSLQVSGVSFRLSDKAREAEEKRLLAKAAANFKEKAGAAAGAFGFGSYQLKELALSQSGYRPVPRPIAMMAMKGVADSATMPSEGGDSDVAVTVSGSVMLTK